MVPRRDGIQKEITSSVAPRHDLCERRARDEVVVVVGLITRPQILVPSLCHHRRQVAIGCHDGWLQLIACRGIDRLATQTHTAQHSTAHTHTRREAKRAWELPCFSPTNCRLGGQEKEKKNHGIFQDRRVVSIGIHTCHFSETLAAPS